jgi:hypothetical protein
VPTVSDPPCKHVHSSHAKPCSWAYLRTSKCPPPAASVQRVAASEFIPWTTMQMSIFENFQVSKFSSLRPSPCIPWATIFMGILENFQVPPLQQHACKCICPMDIRGDEYTLEPPNALYQQQQHTVLHPRDLYVGVSPFQSF